MSKALLALGSLALALYATSCGPQEVTPATTITQAPPPPTVTKTSTATKTTTATKHPTQTPAPPTATPHQLGALVDVPPECYQPTPTSPPYVPFQPCTASLGGRYFAFFFGPEHGCTRGIMVVDAGSGELLYTEPYGALAFEFLTNGKMLLTSGHCEGAYMRILDPATSQLDVLGDGSYQLWNPRKTAFVVTASPYHGLESTLWGYSVIEDFVFLQQPVVWQSDNHPLWTPDGTHVMFLRRALIREDSVYNFPSPRQIVRVEAATGRETILLEDPRYDFHLCANAYSWCDIWYGDWVQVRRFPFQPQTVDDSLDVYGPQTNCLEYGEDCPQDPDLFALNSRTGELIPWDADLFPPPTPRPKFTAGPGMG